MSIPRNFQNDHANVLPRPPFNPHRELRSVAIETGKDYYQWYRLFLRSPRRQVVVKRDLFALVLQAMLVRDRNFSSGTLAECHAFLRSFLTLLPGISLLVRSRRREPGYPVDCGAAPSVECQRAPCRCTGMSLTYRAPKPSPSCPPSRLSRLQRRAPQLWEL